MTMIGVGIGIGLLMARRGEVDPPAPVDGYAPLTSVESGLVYGTNFSDAGITDATSLQAHLAAIGKDLVPAAGRWQLVTDDPIQPKIARLNFTGTGNSFWMNLTNTVDGAVRSVRFRTIIRFNGLTSLADLNNHPLFRFDNDATAREFRWFGVSGRSMLGGTPGVGFSEAIDEVGSPLGDKMVVGDFVEMILELDNDGTSTTAMRAYFNDVGAARDKFIESVRSPYADDDPEMKWVGIFYQSSSGYKNGSSADFRMLEFCDVYDEAEAKIPIANMGDGDGSDPDPDPDPEVGPDERAYKSHWGFQDADDVALRAKIFNGIPTYSDVSKKGTATTQGAAIYMDGDNADLIFKDESVLFEGRPTLGYRLPPNTSVTPKLWVALPASTERAWQRRYHRYEIGFTTNGNAAGATGADSFKHGAYWGFGNVPGQSPRTYGRTGLEITNTTQYELYGFPQNNGGQQLSTPRGATANKNVTTEWSAGEWWEEYSYFKKLTSTTYRVSVYRGKYQGAISLWYTYDATMDVGLTVPFIETFNPAGENFNRIRGAAQDFKYNIGGWDVFLLDDPFNLL